MGDGERWREGGRREGGRNGGKKMGEMEGDREGGKGDQESRPRKRCGRRWTQGTKSREGPTSKVMQAQDQPGSLSCLTQAQSRQERRPGPQRQALPATELPVGSEAGVWE